MAPQTRSRTLAQAQAPAQISRPSSRPQNLRPLRHYHTPPVSQKSSHYPSLSLSPPPESPTGSSPYPETSSEIEAAASALVSLLEEDRILQAARILFEMHNEETEQEEDRGDSELDGEETEIEDWTLFESEKDQEGELRVKRKQKSQKLHDNIYSYLIITEDGFACTLLDSFLERLISRSGKV